MRLRTRPVGPLPTAIYWRRRAVLLVLVVVPILALATCAFSGDDDEPVRSRSSVEKDHKKPQQNLPKIQDGSKEHPFYPVPGPPPAGQEGVAAQQPALNQPPTEPQAPALSPQCADSEIKVEVQPEHRNYPVGSRLKIKLAISNVSNRDCLRDVGAGQQEISAQNGTNKVWSSDHCASASNADERTLKAGERLEFWVVWTGSTSAEGCPEGQNVAGADYHIIGRVGSATSEPATVTLS